MTNLDAIIRNLLLLKEQRENEQDDLYWEDEFGGDLTYMISCHPVFSDGEPCLNDVRKAKYGSPRFYENCKECKAKWLLEKYE